MSGKGLRLAESPQHSRQPEVISLCGTALLSLKQQRYCPGNQRGGNTGEVERWTEIQRFHTFSTRRAPRVRDSSAKNLGLKWRKLKSIHLRSWELEFLLTVPSSAIRERAHCQSRPDLGWKRNSVLSCLSTLLHFTRAIETRFSSLRRSGKFPHQEEMTKLCINNSQCLTTNCFSPTASTYWAVWCTRRCSWRPGQSSEWPLNGPVWDTWPQNRERGLG